MLSLAYENATIVNFSPKFISLLNFPGLQYKLVEGVQDTLFLQNCSLLLIQSLRRLSSVFSAIENFKTVTLTSIFTKPPCEKTDLVAEQFHVFQYWQIKFSSSQWGLCEYVIIHTFLPPSLVISWIELGGKPKWRPLDFAYRDVMGTSPIEKRSSPQTNSESHFFY